MSDGTKPSNPKDALGIKKVPYSTLPIPVMAEVAVAMSELGWGCQTPPGAVPFASIPNRVAAEAGVGMFEGARKYGRHNYRVIGVRASVYFDSTVARHLPAWWEGEDIDPDSGLNHVTKAITSLIVLRDAMIQNKFMDDRPPRSPSGWLGRLNEKFNSVAWIETAPPASFFYNGVMSHMAAWWEGEDVSPESENGLHNITLALAWLFALRAAMLDNRLVDDRPMAAPAGWMNELNTKIEAVVEKYPKAVDPYTETGEREKAK